MPPKRRKLFPISTSTNETGCPDHCDPSCPYDCFPEPNFHFPVTPLLIPLPPPPPPPSPPPPSPSSNSGGPVVFPYVIVGVSLLAAIFLLVSYYCYTWSRSRHRPPPHPLSDGPSDELLNQNQGPETDHHIWYINTVGLQPSVINSIAVVKYKARNPRMEGNSACSVCLSEFQEEETLRLLPQCNHAFHIACIDAWLRAHTNCPLCRSAVLSNTSCAPSGSNERNSIYEDNSENTVRSRESGDNDADTGVFENRGRVGVEVEPMDSKEIGVSDCPDHPSAVNLTGEKERRSVSLDSLRAADITVDVADSSAGDGDDSSSTLGSIPVSVKRSLSCSGGLFSSSRYRKSSSSILPL